MQVPLLDLKRQYDEIKGEIQNAVDNVLESTRYIMGKQGQNLETEIADYCDVKYGIGTGSGTDALLLSLRALDIKAGDEVIVSTFTFFATAGAVCWTGGTPVFCDIDPATYNLDPDLIEDLITDKTAAIIPVHLYGQPAEMDKINEIAARHDIKVVEDACQAIGAEYRGIKIGNFGNTAALSFFPSKNLGGAGDGGMVLTNSECSAEKIKKLRVHGEDPKYFHKEIGYNSRLDEIQAAILRVKLQYLDKWNRGRQRVAGIYNNLFREAALDQLLVLPEKKVEDSVHVFHQYVIRTEERDGLQEFLGEHGISTAIYYPVPLHLQECFRELGYEKGDLPVSEKMCKEVLALPIDPALTEEEIGYVVDKFKQFFMGKE